MFGSLPEIIIALIAISVLVLVHEIGHFVAAKLLGVWPEEFGIGLPPRVWGKKFGETIYSVNALPIGGFVKLHGEVSESGVTKPKRAFINQPAWKKIVIALAGVTMNVVFAVLLFILIYVVNGIPKGAIVAFVQEGKAAAEAGVIDGDRIISVAGENVDDFEYFSPMVKDYLGRDVDMMIERGGETLSLSVNLPESVSLSEGPLGVIIAPVDYYRPPLWQQPFVYSYYGARMTGHMTNQIIRGFGEIYIQLSGGQAPRGLTGPIGVVGIAAEVVKYGFLRLAEFTAIISINLALINLIPFPPLDGSRVLFTVVESIFGKKLVPRIETAIHTTGMALLLLLMLVLSFNEIPKLISAGSLSGFVDSLLQ